ILAPLFIFFLYIIIMFGDSFKLITYDVGNSTDWMDKIMKVLIPFGIVFALLQKAKALAVQYSGEVGAMMNKFGGAVGGVALMAATGGVAALGRNSFGRIGSAIEKSAGLNEAEAKGGPKGFFAARIRDVGKLAGKSSFDARSVKIAGKSIASATGLNVREARKGGYEKARQEKTIKRQKRAEELKVSEDEGLKQELNKTERDLQTLLNANKDLLDKVDKEIEIKAKELQDISAQFGHGSDKAKEAGVQLQNEKDKKIAIRTGGKYQEKELGDVKKTKLVDSGVRDKQGNQIMLQEEYYEKEGVVKDKGEEIDFGDEKKYKTSMGEYKDKNGKKHKRTIDNMQKIEKHEKEKAIRETNRKRANDYADKITKWNWFKTNRDAAHNIRMDVKINDTGEK
ncbi:MAG: hypothetical protein WC898_03535, partial [Candidatus Paceibacterota bacterium]